MWSLRSVTKPAPRHTGLDTPSRAAAFSVRLPSAINRSGIDHQRIDGPVSITRSEALRRYAPRFAATRSQAITTAQVALLVSSQRKYRRGDASGVQRVRLADPSVVLAAHARGLDDLVARGRNRPSQLSAIRRGALDDPQHLQISGSGPSSLGQWPAAVAGASPGRSHDGAGLWMSHNTSALAHRLDSLLIKSPTWAENGAGHLAQPDTSLPRHL